MAEIKPISPAGTPVSKPAAAPTLEAALASLIHAVLQGGGDSGAVAVAWHEAWLAAKAKL